MWSNRLIWIYWDRSHLSLLWAFSWFRMTTQTSTSISMTARVRLPLDPQRWEQGLQGSPRAPSGFLEDTRHRLFPTKASAPGTPRKGPHCFGLGCARTNHWAGAWGSGRSGKRGRRSWSATRSRPLPSNMAARHRTLCGPSAPPWAALSVRPPAGKGNSGGL